MAAIFNFSRIFVLLIIYLAGAGHSRSMQGLVP